MYRLSDEVVLFAAISQLKNRAHDWYKRQPIDSVALWEDFKYHIRHYFEVKESFTATLAKIGQRIWKSHTEKFVDYAEDKLNLMQHLSLSEKEKIASRRCKRPSVAEISIEHMGNNSSRFYRLCETNYRK